MHHKNLSLRLSNFPLWIFLSCVLLVGYAIQVLCPLSTSFSKKESLKFWSRYSVRWWFYRAEFELKKSIFSFSSKSNFTVFSAFSSSSVKKDNLSKNFYFFFGALSLYFFDSLLKAVRRSWKFFIKKILRKPSIKETY